MVDITNHLTVLAFQIENTSPLFNVCFHFQNVRFFMIVFKFGPISKSCSLSLMILTSLLQ